MKMDEQLRVLIAKLGVAINETLSESAKIASAIGEINRAGYDLFLALEATVGFKQRGAAVSGPAEAVEPIERDERGMPMLTPKDQEFLHGLKITIEDPNAPRS